MIGNVRLTGAHPRRIVWICCDRKAWPIKDATLVDYAYFVLACTRRKTDRRVDREVETGGQTGRKAGRQTDGGRTDGDRDRQTDG